MRILIATATAGGGHLAAAAALEEAWKNEQPADEIARWDLLEFFSPLHRRIYAADADAHCVLHTHATHLVALTLAGVWRADDILPPLTPYQLMKVGHVPLVPYHRPGDPAVAQFREALAQQK